MSMWEKFTEPARRAVFYAQEEARALDEQYVSTEHLLLGALRERNDTASILLLRMGIDPAQADLKVRQVIARGPHPPTKDLELTPRAKKAIDLALDDARLLNNNYIGTEHLLLGMIREAEGLAGKVLRDLGASADAARQEVMALQAAAGGVWPPPPTSTPSMQWNASTGASPAATKLLNDSRLCFQIARGIAIAIVAFVFLPLMTPSIPASSVRLIRLFLVFAYEAVAGSGLVLAVNAKRVHPAGIRLKPASIAWIIIRMGIFAACGLAYAYWL